MTSLLRFTAATYKCQSKVIEQCRDNSREENQDASGECGESPVKPRDANARISHFLQKGGPKVALQLGLLRRWHRRAKFCAKFLEFPVVHGVTPACVSFLRRIRTARNMRSFVAASEMPSASAMAR